MNNILFTSKAKGFTIVPNKVLVATNISMKAKALYGYLISKPNKWSFSVRRIANEMKEGKDAINNVMRELEDCKLLKRRQIKDGEKWGGTAYYIADVDDSNIVSEFRGKVAEKITTPIDERKENFRTECLEVYNNKPEMGQALGKKFFTYWTEKTRGKRLMKFELQDTFEIGLRMDMFIQNQKIYDQERIDKKQNKKTELTTKNT